MLEAEALNKPDMPAVIDRTHITIDLHGLLLPIFEAISNSIHGIEQRFSDIASSSGIIVVSFQRTSSPKNLLISVCDNGAGLDDVNYKSFRTPFSGLKLAKRGRGFGRFIAFKVFDRILYSSNHGYEELGVRTFRFNIYDEREIIHFDGTPDFSGPGVCVEFDGLKSEWVDVLAELRENVVADEVAHHFFPEFLKGELPLIELRFEGSSVDLTSRFRGLFRSDWQSDIEIEIEGKTEKLDCTLSRVPKSKKFAQNAILFSAGGRIVGKPRDLSQKLGRSFFINDKDEKYIVIAVVSGDPLERRLNDARTSLDLSPKTVEEIVGAVASLIESQEGSQVILIKQEQKRELIQTLESSPILRMGLAGETLDDYVAKKPNSWGPDQFVSDLALRRHRVSNDLIRSIAAAAKSEESYYENLKEIVAGLDDGKKDALAEYVVHRRKIIGLLDTARKFDESGGRAPEEAVHDLVFRRYSDNTSQSYFEHNLWLVDDALAFCPYISSDRTLHGGRRQAGDKVTDLLFYDDSLIMGEIDGSSVVIVEFKKPTRDDYRFGPAKSDPVIQVIETLGKAVSAGGITKQDGAHFSFANVTRRFAYIIADLTPSLISVLKKHDFKNDWNPKVWFRYRDTEQIAIYVNGYDTMIENAKKRNAAFFSVLLDE